MKMTQTDTHVFYLVCMFAKEAKICTTYVPKATPHSMIVLRSNFVNESHLKAFNEPNMFQGLNPILTENSSASQIKIETPKYPLHFSIKHFESLFFFST